MKRKAEKDQGEGSPSPTKRYKLPEGCLQIPKDTSPSHRQSDRLAALHDLPVELLHEILLFSLNPAFTALSRSMHQVFTSTGPQFRANYLMRVTPDTNGTGYITEWWRIKLEAWLSFRICNYEVLQLLIKQSRPPAYTVTQPPDRENPIINVTLPKHILRHFSRTTSEGVDSQWDSEAVAMGFLRYLLGPIDVSPPAPCPSLGLPSIGPITPTLFGNPDSHQGYFLARAVYLRHEPLVDLLLAHGADPLQKRGVAIKFAIKHNDEPLVRKLILRCRLQQFHFDNIGRELLGCAVQNNARHIAYYFIRELGIAPSLDTLKHLK